MEIILAYGSTYGLLFIKQLEKENPGLKYITSSLFGHNYYIDLLWDMCMEFLIYTMCLSSSYALIHIIIILCILHHDLFLPIKIDLN